MEIVPGKSFGGFLLGMNSQDACNFILKSKHLSHVELKYNEKDPLAVDLIVDLIEDGYLLRFDSMSQVLKIVEVYDIPKVKLLYSGSVFSTTSDKAPTLVNIYEKFGPTRPGEYDTVTGHYYLHYPGLTFSFAIPKKFEALFDNLNGIPPMEFPDRTTPLASRIIIYYGSNPKVPEMPPIISSSKDKPYFEEIIVQISKGITFTNRKVTLDFQSSTEDVLTLLGPPSKIFYKEEDKMKIHTSSYSGLGCCDYFYNYFHLGIDFLFDSQSHLIKKFILHTNFPSHHEFNQYVKCNFKIIVQNKSKKEGQIITSDSRWNIVQEILGDAGKPIVHNRGTNLNPFGPTLFYGYNDGLIVEVMPNSYIATIQLWNPVS